MSQNGNTLLTALTFAPVLLGVAFAALATFLIGAPRLHVGLILGLYVLGFLMFLQAKRSVKSRESLLSFGSKRMTPSNRSLYKIGYGLMFVATLLTYVLYSLSTATPSPNPSPTPHG